MFEGPLDIERLHKVVHKINTGAYRRPRSGLSRAYLELMYGEAELGEDHNFYLYVAPTSSMAYQMEEAFKQLIERRMGPIQTQDADLTYIFHPEARRPHTIDVNNKSFMFQDIHALKNGNPLRTIHLDRVFLDVNTEMLEDDSVLRMVVNQTLMFIMASAKGRGGDVI